MEKLEETKCVLSWQWCGQDCFFQNVSTTSSTYTVVGVNAGNGQSKIRWDVYVFHRCIYVIGLVVILLAIVVIAFQHQHPCRYCLALVLLNPELCALLRDIGAFVSDKNRNNCMMCPHHLRSQGYKHWQIWQLPNRLGCRVAKMQSNSPSSAIPQKRCLGTLESNYVQRSRLCWMLMLL